MKSVPISVTYAYIEIRAPEKFNVSDPPNCTAGTQTKVGGGGNTHKYQ
jgi:hypothetical protein